MRTGLRTCASTSFFTDDSMVAEKNMVWRSAGMTDTIRLMEGRNPISSMRSASSRIRMRTLLNSISRRSRKSQKRPGVATTIAAPARICLSCTRSFMPPTATAAWIKEGKIDHDMSHVHKLEAAKLPEAEKKLGVRLAKVLKNRKAILGVFDLAF